MQAAPLDIFHTLIFQKNHGNNQIRVSLNEYNQPTFFRTAMQCAILVQTRMANLNLDGFLIAKW